MATVEVNDSVGHIFYGDERNTYTTKEDKPEDKNKEQIKQRVTDDIIFYS